MDVIAALDPRWAWWIAAVLLAVAEIVVPGIFLIWLALAAAVAGLVALLLDPPMVVDFGVFAAAAVASIYVGRNLYRRTETPPDPLLNDRAARLVGTHVTICEAVSPRGGRATVGDGSWPARGPDMAVGTVATVVAVEGNTLVVEAI
jgi:membrane protein implicated in regulation of membrane protease activity